MSVPTESKKIVVQNSPAGPVNLDYTLPDSTFKVVTEPLPNLEDGQVLVKTLYLSNDPTQRGWIQKDAKPESSYLPPVPQGGVVRASGIAEIVESKSNKYSKGDIVSAFVGWTQYNVLPEAMVFSKIPKSDVPLPYALGPLGMTGMTAYFGLDIFKPKSSDTVVISAASGATGSTAVQLAKKVYGCKNVVGIAGGKQKCDYVKSIGADSCVDYTDSANLEKNLRQAIGIEKSTDGADIYFDNVGGEVLDTMLPLVKLHGGIIACGAVAGYNDHSKMAIKNWAMVITRRLNIKGFIITDFASRNQECIGNLIKYVQEGKLDISSSVVVNDLSNDFENIPTTWATLFDTSKKQPGKLVTKVADSE